MPKEFDFAVWKKDQEQKRKARREELRMALEDGFKIRQRCGTLNSVWPDCSPFIESCNNPEYLSEHIESREYSFGFDTEVIHPDDHDQRAEDEANYNRMIGASLRRY